VGTAAVLADIQERLKSDQVETAIIALLVVCGLAMVIVLRTVQKVATRLLVLGLLFIVGIGLWVQRENLKDCQGQCTCRLFAQDIDMEEVPGVNCPD
jgi:uncharacterized membrane protein YdfJ with MMPL/SSD domain